MTPRQIRDFRKAQGWSQETFGLQVAHKVREILRLPESEISRRIKVPSQSDVSRWETGAVQPNLLRERAMELLAKEGWREEP